VDFKAYAADCNLAQSSLKRLMAAALPAVVATALFLSAASPASAGVGVDITIAPPAPRVVVAPPPRAGYVWAPGYWRWDGGRHVWVDGRWMRARRNFHWMPEHWDEGRHGHYHFVPGHWAHN
jgi:hypothetical protein